MFSRVVIDPGHGGIDPGSSAFGMVEKELTLDLARRLERILSSHGLKTELTRRTDKYVELGERAERANAKPGTIFVSIHFNAHTGFYLPSERSGPW